MMFDLLEKLSPIETLEDMGNSELILGSTTIIHISMLEVSPSSSNHECRL